MLNEVFARAVLAERARDREISMFLTSLHDSEVAPARRRSRRGFLRLPRLAGAPVTTQPQTRRLCVKA
jgi:hypothetical protein